MSWSIQKKRWYHHWLVWAVVVLSVACFLGWPKARAQFRRWNAGRQVHHAEERIAQGDFRQAMLAARSALDANPMDPKATRIMAVALEGGGAAAMAAQWRSRLDSITPGNLENILAWASDSLKGGDVAAAERILAMLKPAPVNDATYHATAAEVAAAKHDSAGTELHWAEAARLDPGDGRYRLRLAILRLGSRSAATHDAAVETLREFSVGTPEKLQALRALLADAANFRDWRRAYEFTNALVAEPGSTFQDKLTRLATLRAMKAAEATGYLTELRNGTLSNPGELYLLLMWMNQHDLALLVADWARTLPQDVTGLPPVCVAVADAYVRSSDWQRLREFLDERTWAEWDYMRRAFLARALERLDEGEQAAQEWKDGISAARSRADARERLERMVRLAIGWGWEQRAQEVMWSMAGSPNCPRWMLDALWLIEIENKDAVKLQKLAGILAQADAKSVEFRNNYAFFSLLVRSDDGNPHREAERLFNENPGNAAIAVTRGLSLCLQGKPTDAAGITGSLPPAELAKPQVALYHAIFLTAAGDTAKAAGFIPVAQGWKMFAEEKSLLDRVKLAAAKVAEDEAQVSSSTQTTVERKTPASLR
jgi:hypothetical protein